MILQKQVGIFFLLYISFCPIGHSQNLLNNSSWVPGTGSVSDFTINGSDSENIRELGLNHIGAQVVLWKAVPDMNNNADGGWDSSYHTIDNTKTYRFSVWIKKTNSFNGVSYFGSQQWSSAMDNHSVLRLNGNFDDNPYFWNNDNGNNQLPHLNRWYLLVGFIHHKDYLQTTSQGAIYDGVTGVMVQNITDFKFHSNTTEIRHRAYLYYDTNTNDRQYFYEPRIDIVNTSMPTVNQLLNINENSKLIFTYDNAGNQGQRFYCSDLTCIVPNQSASRPVVINVENAMNFIETQDSNMGMVNRFVISPNPTDGKFTISSQEQGYYLDRQVNIYNINGALVQQIEIKKPSSSLQLDISNANSGVYLIHIHFSDGKTINQRIIKN